MKKLVGTKNMNNIRGEELKATVSGKKQKGRMKKKTERENEEKNRKGE